MIGFVEATGLDRSRRVLRRPLRVVRLDDRDPADPLRELGVWFLDPIGDPRPLHGDIRRPVSGGLRIDRLRPDRLLRSLADRLS